MTTTINVKTPAELRKAYSRIAKGIQGPFKSTRRLFVQLGVLIDRDTIMTFKKEGAYQDRQKWIDFGWGQGINYYQNKNGTFKKRPGTDSSPSRRYSTGSRLLQASGGFRNSFRILQIGNERMRYGTQFDKSEHIVRRRPVLQYTRQDETRYATLIANWWFKETKI